MYVYIYPTPDYALKCVICNKKPELDEYTQQHVIIEQEIDSNNQVVKQLSDVIKIASQQYPKNRLDIELWSLNARNSSQAFALINQLKTQRFAMIEPDIEAISQIALAISPSIKIVELKSINKKQALELEKYIGYFNNIEELWFSRIVQPDALKILAKKLYHLPALKKVGLTVIDNVDVLTACKSITVSRDSDITLYLDNLEAYDLDQCFKLYRTAINNTPSTVKNISLSFISLDTLCELLMNTRDRLRHFEKVKIHIDSDDITTLAGFIDDKKFKKSHLHFYDIHGGDIQNQFKQASKTLSKEKRDSSIKNGSTKKKRSRKEAANQHNKNASQPHKNSLDVEIEKRINQNMQLEYQTLDHNYIKKLPYKKRANNEKFENQFITDDSVISDSNQSNTSDSNTKNGFSFFKPKQKSQNDNFNPDQAYTHLYFQLEETKAKLNFLANNTVAPNQINTTLERENKKLKSEVQQLKEQLNQSQKDTSKYKKLSVSRKTKIADLNEKLEQSAHENDQSKQKLEMAKIKFNGLINLYENAVKEVNHYKEDLAKQNHAPHPSTKP